VWEVLVVARSMWIPKRHWLSSTLIAWRSQLVQREGDVVEVEVVELISIRGGSTCCSGNSVFTGKFVWNFGFSLAFTRRIMPS
jgi:hypothetical protein